MNNYRSKQITDEVTYEVFYDTAVTTAILFTFGQLCSNIQFTIILNLILHFSTATK